jgi:hypothetical protein
MDTPLDRRDSLLHFWFARTGRALLLAVICGAAGALLGGGVPACTLDVGENFQVAEVVYDEGFFYCEVEPMLFAQGCGSGDADLGETAQGCHFNRQGLRLTDYSPVAAEQCVGGQIEDSAVPRAARQNYQSAQLSMEVDPERSPLLNRPSRGVAHPRIVFEPDSAEAEIIRTWGTRYSN